MYYRIVIKFRSGTSEERYREIEELLRGKGLHHEDSDDTCEVNGVPYYYLSSGTDRVGYADVKDIPEVQNVFEYARTEVVNYVRINGKETAERPIVLSGFSKGSHERFSEDGWASIHVWGMAEGALLDEIQLRKSGRKNPFAHKCFYGKSGKLCRTRELSTDASVEDIDRTTCVDCLRILAKRWLGSVRKGYQNDRFDRLSKVL